MKTTISLCNFLSDLLVEGLLAVCADTMVEADGMIQQRSWHKSFNGEEADKNVQGKSPLRTPTK